MARGAAALGANCQPGFDAVYPYVYGGTDLDPKKIGFIIVQVKNDSNTCRHADVFPNMDPFKCGLLKDENLEGGILPIPIIRLFFSLSGKVEFQIKKCRRSKRKTVKGTTSKFTSYDFECSGISEDILLPVGTSPQGWASLANRTDPWSSLYNVSVPDVLRSQFPGSGIDEGHWMNWVEDEDF